MDILELLLAKHILKKEDVQLVEKELQSSGRKAEELLVQKRKVDEDLLFQMKSEALGMPLSQVETSEIPLKVLELIPEDSAKYYKMVPLVSSRGRLEVGMVYPEDAKAHEALQFLARQGKFSYTGSLFHLSHFLTFN